jgi:hypothetical protein
MIHKSTRVLIQDSGYKALEGVIAPFALWTGERVDMSGNPLIEPSEAIKIKLINGVELTCSPDQNFRTMHKRRGDKGITAAKDLTNNHFVHLTESTYEFDYLDLGCYNYLNKLTSEELGTLVGLSQNLGMFRPDLPKSRKECHKELDRLYAKMQVPVTKVAYYKRTDRFKYEFPNLDYLEELQDFQGFQEKFWDSKLFLRGYLKGMFTFCNIGNEMFTLRSFKGSCFLKEVQQALLLFGINSSYSNGLKMSQLIVFKNNCYRFSNNIGILNPEALFQGVDFRRFLKYKDRTTNEMRYSKVHSVEQAGQSELVELNASQVMANGVILENYE